MPPSSSTSRRAGLVRQMLGKHSREVRAIAVFQMVTDQTLNTPADDNPNNPIVYNCIISHYPDETTEIELSPGNYTELLPQIAMPFGNIHFASDYTHPADDVRLMKFPARLFNR